MSTRLLLPRPQAVGLDGRPLAGAKLYTYTTGTNTPKPVYSDAALTIPHANPVVADAAGRWPGMFLTTGEYRIVLEDAAGTVISTDDPVAGAVASSPAQTVLAIITLDSQTASNSASLDFFGDLDDTYDRYELEFNNLVPATDDVALLLRVGTGAGPTWQSGASAYATTGWITGASTGVFLGGAGSGVFLTGNSAGLRVGNAAGEFISGVVELDNPEAAKFPVATFRTRFVNDGAVLISASGAGRYSTSGAITGLQLFFSSGNIVSGTARLIAYAKS